MKKVVDLLKSRIIYVFLLVMLVFFSITSPNFLTVRNLMNIVKQVAIYGIASVGMTYVILLGGIDLSIGSIISLVNILAAVSYTHLDVYKRQDLGLIKEEGAMDSNGGRKSMGYSCNKDAKFAVGINISKNYVDLAIVNLVLEAVYTRHEKIQIRGNETSYKWLKEYISDAIEKARISRKKILGIGYALPAIIDESGTRIYGLHEEMDLPRNFYEIVREWFPLSLIHI